jgi:hypothetical protein
MGQCPVERQWSQGRVIPGAGPVKRLRDRPAGRHRQEPAQAHPVLAQAYQRFLAQTGLTLEPEPPYTSNPSLSTSVALLTAAMAGAFIPTGGLPEFVRWIPAGNGRNEGMAFTG